MEDEVKEQIEGYLYGLFQNHTKEAVERVDDFKGLDPQQLYPGRARFASPRPIAT